jgi:hypothetical protein
MRDLGDCNVGTKHMILVNVGAFVRFGSVVQERRLALQENKV